MDHQRHWTIRAETQLVQGESQLGLAGAQTFLPLQFTNSSFRVIEGRLTLSLFDKFSVDTYVRIYVCSDMHCSSILMHEYIAH